MYLNKHVFRQQLIDWQTTGKLSDDLVSSLTSLVEGVVSKYTNKANQEECISRWWVTILESIDKVDVDQNPFSWFTQQAIWACIHNHRIESQATKFGAAFSSAFTTDEEEGDFFSMVADERRYYPDDDDNEMSKIGGVWQITIDGVTDTLQGWCDRKRININTVISRHQEGWHWIEAIVTPVDEPINMVGDISLREWCKQNDKSYNTIYRRLGNGESIESAISRPISKPREATFGGQTKTVVEWCKVKGLKYDMVKWRMRKMTPEKAISIVEELSNSPQPQTLSQAQ